MRYALEREIGGSFHYLSTVQQRYEVGELMNCKCSCVYLPQRLTFRKPIPYDF